jgi:hypothetical protein
MYLIFHVFDFSSEESSDEMGSLSATFNPKLPAVRPKRPPKATTTVHGHSNINWNAIYSMQNQPMY